MSKASPRRLRWWQLTLVSTVSAALGAGLTVAAYGATTARPQVAGNQAAAQPAGTASRALAAPGTGVVDPAVSPYLAPKQLMEVPVGPGNVAKPVQKILTSPAVMTALDVGGIPAVAVEAYQRAAASLAVSDAACHLPWQLLAAIGRVESDNGQFGGAMLLANGYGTRPIYGLPLDGRDGVALIRDTDGGKLDGDPNFDRAVGPMQFIPSTWAVDGADGNGDGKKDPNNIFDAALAAAGYLCASGDNLAIPAQETAAVLTYNDADEYARVVTTLAAGYEHGEFPAVPAPGPVSTGGGGFTAGTPSVPFTEPPAPTQLPVQSASALPPQTPTSQPAKPSSPATTAAPTARPTATRTASPTATPTASPTATPTASPSGGTATATPTTPGPTGTTATGSAPSGEPSQSPAPSFSAPPHQPIQCADVGWAPAMRQVVVKLLGTAKASPAQPGRRSHPGPQPTGVSSTPARRTTGPNNG